MPLEWSNDQIIAFLELLETERVIWDTNDRNHKFKHKVNAAWKRISEIMNCPIVELKSKKKSLMATFRPLIKKKMNSIKSGTCADDVFQPIWFAFDIMERFLGPIYVVEDTMNTEYQFPQGNSTLPNQSSTHFQEIDGMPPSSLQPVIKMEVPETVPENIPKTVPEAIPVTIPNRSTKTFSKKRPRTMDDIVSDAEKKINDSFTTLCHVLEKKKADEDECDAYAKLLAKKLRRYPERMRDRIMHKIDGLLLDNPYPDERPSSGGSQSS